MEWFNRLFGLSPQEDILRFRCNICGRQERASRAHLTREEATCRCGSSVRLRSLVHVLSQEIFGSSLAVPDFPFRPDIVGVDMSGAATYAGRLAEKIGYINTFFHQAPHLDITNPDSAWIGKCDFVISSDVFEHVLPPVARAFENTARLLKPGGVFILTVPYAKMGNTIEHFPMLHDFRIETRNGSRVLVNMTIQGQKQEFDHLIFHGGEGETLEMRVFSEAAVLQELQQAGFEDIRIHREPCLEFGILWPQDWSLPISARRPRA